MMALAAAPLLVLGAACSTLLFLSPAHADSPLITSNPYTGPYGSPDCTWYGWQRLHDTQGIDLQFVASPSDWTTDAA